MKILRVGLFYLCLSIIKKTQCTNNKLKTNLRKIEYANKDEFIPRSLRKSRGGAQFPVNFLQKKISKKNLANKFNFGGVNEIIDCAPKPDPKPEVPSMEFNLNIDIKNEGCCEKSSCSGDSKPKTPNVSPCKPKNPSPSVTPEKCDIGTKPKPKPSSPGKPEKPSSPGKPEKPSSKPPSGLFYGFNPDQQQMPNLIRVNPDSELSPPVSSDDNTNGPVLTGSSFATAAIEPLPLSFNQNKMIYSDNEFNKRENTEQRDSEFTKPSAYGLVNNRSGSRDPLASLVSDEREEGSLAGAAGNMPSDSRFAQRDFTNESSENLKSLTVKKVRQNIPQRARVQTLAPNLVFEAEASAADDTKKVVLEKVNPSELKPVIPVPELVVVAVEAKPIEQPDAVLNPKEVVSEDVKPAIVQVKPEIIIPEVVVKEEIKPSIEQPKAVPKREVVVAEEVKAPIEHLKLEIMNPEVVVAAEEEVEEEVEPPIGQLENVQKQIHDHPKVVQELTTDEPIVTKSEITQAITPEIDQQPIAKPKDITLQPSEPSEGTTSFLAMGSS